MNTIDLSLSFTILRQLLQVGGGIAVARGYTDEQTATQLIGGVVALGSIIWGLIVSQRKNAVIANVIGTP